MGRFVLSFRSLTVLTAILLTGCEAPEFLQEAPLVGSFFQSESSSESSSTPACENSNGKASEKNPNCASQEKDPAPAVDSISPNSGTLNGGTAVRIEGQYFRHGASAKIGSRVCVVTASGSKFIECVTPPPNDPGVYSITVTNPDNQEGVLSGAYTYRSAPTVTSVSPSSSTVSGGGTLTVSGTGFTSAILVTLGEYTCSLAQVISSTSATCTLPAATAGTYDVKVTNSDGQYGSLSQSLVYQTASGSYAVMEISAGSAHSCFRLNDGSVRCVGYDGFGQLGDSSAIADQASAVTVSGVSNAVALSSGMNHSCALISGGTIKCWGSNDFGQMGHGTTQRQPVPIQIPGITNAISITSGSNHNCALLSDSTIRCWGGDSYNYGFLGNNGGFPAHTPVTVSGITDAVSVSAGAAHVCARRSNGTIICWGLDAYGALGNGPGASTTCHGGVACEPVPATAVSGISNAVSVSSGAYHTCAVLTDGTIKCWGRNSRGEIGDGTSSGDFATTNDRHSPVTVSGITNAISVVGGQSSTCALTSGGTVKCWGVDIDGTLGNDSNFADQAVPVAVSGITNAVKLFGGPKSSHFHVLNANGSVQGWGYVGMVHGTGSSAYVPTPVTFNGWYTSTSCAFQSFAKNGLFSGASSCTEYRCPFYNLGGSSSGNYIFSFYQNGTTDNQMMTYPNYLNLQYEVEPISCTLKIIRDGVTKFELTQPTVNNSNELTGFHHYCVYCGGRDNAVGCTLQNSSH